MDATDTDGEERRVVRRDVRWLAGSLAVVLVDKHGIHLAGQLIYSDNIQPASFSSARLSGALRTTLASTLPGRKDDTASAEAKAARDVVGDVSGFSGKKYRARAPPLSQATYLGRGEY